jgi:hypothetical protein
MGLVAGKAGSNAEFAGFEITGLETVDGMIGYDKISMTDLRARMALADSANC